MSRRSNGDFFNPGLEKAQQAAVKIGFSRVIFPEFPDDHPEKPTDFNDLHRLYGLDAVRARIDEALAAPMPPPPKAAVPAPKRREPPDNHPDRVEWESQLIYRDRDGHFLAENSVNYKLVICNHPRLRHCFAYDEFHLCTMVVQPPPWAEDAGKSFEVHPLSDTDIRNADYFLQKTKNLKGSKEKTGDAIEECGLINAFHPARDYLDALVWDGTPRIDSWLEVYVGGKDKKPYMCAVGRIWLIAAVNRIMEPGCKFDNMLILEGPQEAGKSLTFEILSRFGPSDSYETYFMNTFNIANSEDTDELMKLSGALIVEIQEMSGFNKKDDEAMKKFITTTHDTYRAPYGRRPAKWPRQFVLGGTYNPRDGIFKDSTGLRRFWVVETGDRIDLAGLERDREQLWAEAVYRYKQGESLLLPKEIAAMAKEAAEERRIIDDSTADVLAHAKGRLFFETRDILKGMGISLQPGKSQAESRTVNDILRIQGYRRCKKKRGGVSVWGWEPPYGSGVTLSSKPERDDVVEEVEF